MSADETVIWKVEGLSFTSRDHAMVVGRRMAERMSRRNAYIEECDEAGAVIRRWQIDRKGVLTASGEFF